MQKPSVEVCLSPALFPNPGSDNFDVAIVIDVLRATSSIVTAFDHGVKSIFPVADLSEALRLKKQGLIVAGEADGKKLEFADFGNSPAEFATAAIEGIELVFTSTNGAKAIHIANRNREVLLASFLSLQAVGNYIGKNNLNALIICAGWKSQPCIEDTLCAGALVNLLVDTFYYSLQNDSATIALNVWKTLKTDLFKVVSHSEHGQRLKELGHENDIAYCIQQNISISIPRLEKGKLVLTKN